MISQELKTLSRELLESGKVSMVIGYAAGKREYVHAFFARTPEEADQLVYDENCDRNLAVYLMKKDINDSGRVAIISRPSIMRSIIQLAAENQIKGDNILVIGVTDSNEIKVFETLEELASYVKTIPVELSESDRANLAEIERMSVSERWDFWMKEFETCIKCYACRASCPLCYCTRCTVECNQPQWVHVPSHELGNLEWHIMRAMHLAGRCINCGECRRACPMDIPLNLLTQKLIVEIDKNFGVISAENPDDQFVLATFSKDDKENFIR